MQKAKRFKPYRAVGTRHYGIMQISRGFLKNPEEIIVNGPSANGPWFFEDGKVCPPQYQDVARRADK